MDRVKIFSDRGIVASGQHHIVMLYPFWGKNPEDPNDPNSGRFDDYTEAGRSLFSMTSLDDADIAVLPAPWESLLPDEGSMELALQFLDQARSCKKPVVIFFCSDSDAAIPLEGITVFRTSLYGSTRGPNEFAMPAWSEDFIKRYANSEFPLRHKAGKPVVGFCGFAASPIPSVIRKLLRVSSWKTMLRHSQKLTPGAKLRGKALGRLSGSPEVTTNFIIRDDFLGGILAGDMRDFGRIRQEYVHNLLESDYVLCVRGAGNFSYRLYETLSCGRIPVFLNTDCCLPYEKVIDWRSLCVWVEEDELAGIGEKVADFHAKLSNKAFLELQGQCRRTWEQYLSPLGFFANFHSHFGGL